MESARTLLAAAPSPGSRSRAAASLILADRFEEAEALLRPFADRGAAAVDRDRAVPLLVTALAHQGRRREALAVARTWGHIPGAQADPDDWLAWQILLNERDPTPALREAAAIRASFRSVSRLYVGLLLLGDDPGAAELARLGLTPWDRDLYRGIEAWRRRDLGAAVARFQAVARLGAPSRGLAQWWLAYAAFEAHDDRVAIAAATDFERDLSQCAPWRAWGLARLLYRKAVTQERAGDHAAALATVDRLLGLWKRADPDLPLLAEARALRARLVAALPRR